MATGITVSSVIDPTTGNAKVYGTAQAACDEWTQSLWPGTTLVRSLSIQINGPATWAALTNCGLCDPSTGLPLPCCNSNFTASYSGGASGGSPLPGTNSSPGYVAVSETNVSNTVKILRIANTLPYSICDPSETDFCPNGNAGAVVQITNVCVGPTNTPTPTPTQTPPLS